MIRASIEKTIDNIVAYLVKEGSESKMSSVERMFKEAAAKLANEQYRIKQKQFSQMRGGL